MKAVAIALVSLFTISASEAEAHARLVSSSPPLNSVVQASPTEVVLTFNEPAKAVVVKLLDPAGKELAVLDALADRNTIRCPIKTALAPGKYVVSYRVVGDDAHALSGSIAFKIGD